MVADIVADSQTFLADHKFIVGVVTAIATKLVINEVRRIVEKPIMDEFGRRVASGLKPEPADVSAEGWAKLVGCLALDLAGDASELREDLPRASTALAIKWGLEQQSDHRPPSRISACANISEAFSVVARARRRRSALARGGTPTCTPGRGGRTFWGPCPRTFRCSPSVSAWGT